MLHRFIRSVRGRRAAFVRQRFAEKRLLEQVRVVRVRNQLPGAVALNRAHRLALEGSLRRLPFEGPGGPAVTSELGDLDLLALFHIGGSGASGPVIRFRSLRRGVPFRLTRAALIGRDRLLRPNSGRCQTQNRGDEHDGDLLFLCVHDCPFTYDGFDALGLPRRKMPPTPWAGVSALADAVPPFRSTCDFQNTANYRELVSACGVS